MRPPFELLLSLDWPPKDINPFNLTTLQHSFYNTQLMPESVRSSDTILDILGCMVMSIVRLLGSIPQAAKSFALFRFYSQGNLGNDL